MPKKKDLLSQYVLRYRNKFRQLLEQMYLLRILKFYFNIILVGIYKLFSY